MPNWRDILSRVRDLDEEVPESIKDLFSSTEEPTNPLEIELGGEAKERIELFAKIPAKGVEKDGLMWYPMIYEGQWAMRPGGSGQKKRTPLKVVAGRSKNQIKEIGMQDLADAFGEDAVEYVTVPTSHANTTLENQGYIKGMKIAPMTIQTGPNKGKKVKALWGGYDITEPDTKLKLQNGSIAGRSCGILYGYTNTYTGKTYPAVVEHVALTNKPWITGMVPFGRKVKLAEGEDGTLSVTSLSLSDEEPELDEFELEEADLEGFPSLSTDLADGDVVWESGDSLQTLRGEVSKALDDMRRAYRSSMRDARAQGSYVDYTDDYPYWHVDDVRGKPNPAALICDGYGDGANRFVVPLKQVDGGVELASLDSWQKVRQQLVEDSSGESAAEESATSTSRDNPSTQNPNPPRGGGRQMAGEHEMRLSAEAQREIDELKTQLATSERQRETMARQVDSLLSSDRVDRADKLVKRISALFGDAQPGAMAELRTIMLEDSGEPVVTSEVFSEDGHTEVSLTLSQAFERFADKLEAAQDGKLKLAQDIESPASTEGGSKGPEGESEEDKRERLSREGKPNQGDEEKKTPEQRSAEHFSDPDMVQAMKASGLAVPATTNGSKGGEK